MSQLPDAPATQPHTEPPAYRASAHPADDARIDTPTDTTADTLIDTSADTRAPDNTVGATPPASTPPPPEVGPRVPSVPRLIAGIVLGAGLSLLGGWILGEYPFTGVMPYIAGVLFALVVAEVVVSVSRQSQMITAVAAAVCTVGGLGLGVWISTGRGIDPIPIGGIVAMAIGAVVALLRGGIRGGGRRAASSRPSS